MGLRFFSLISTVILLLGNVCSAAENKEIKAPIAWIAPGWQFRQIITGNPLNPGLKLSIGSVEINTEGNVRPDGADIRVTDIWNNLVPYHVMAVSEDGFVGVEFDLSGMPSGSAYCIYYGNPAAGPVNFESGGSGNGGLSFQAKPYESGKVDSYESFMKLFNAAKGNLGQGVRNSINDHKIPLAVKYQRCLAVYSGMLRVPKDGLYGLQFKATGPAFVTIDGNTVLSQQIAKGAFTSNDGIALSRGDHLIKFVVFSRHPSSYIAKLYWRVPGESNYSLIGPDSFPSTLYFTPTVRQRFGRVVNSFFSHSTQGKLRLIGTTDVLTSICFKDLSSSLLGKISSAEWDFGDGQVSNDREPVHVYRTTGEYTVSLTVTDDMGFKDTSSARLNIDREGAEKLEIQWELQEDTKLIDPGEKTVEVRQSFHMYSVDEREFVLRRATMTGGKIVDNIEEQMKLIPRKEIITTSKLPNPEGSFVTSWTLELDGIELMKRELRVVEDTDRFPEVRSRDASTVDNEGRHIIVKLTGAPNLEKRKFIDIINETRDENITIALIENSLFSVGKHLDESKSYYSKLEKLLADEFPHTNIKIRRFADDQDYFPVQRILKSAAEIYGLDPQVIVIACDLKDLSCFIPFETLKRYYAFMIHNYIAHTRAKIVLVTPPPQPVKAHRSKIVATAISEIGLIHVVGLADVYQAISLWDGDWMTLFQDEETPDDNVYFLYMNSKGQEIIAETIFKAIIQD